MKKINVIAWLITILMTMTASPAIASDWGSENVTMQLGETKTLYLPSSVTSKVLKSVSFYSASYNYVEVVSYTNYSVKVKALKTTSTPVVVRCDYYYYVDNGGYTYQTSGAYDFKVTVEGETVVKPTNITLPSVVAVEVGESKDIEATVTPANAEYTLTWSISDNSIATVYQNGMITGKSVGYADLKVMADNGVYAMCRVSVYQPKPTSVSMQSSHSMKVGETYTLSPTIYPSNSTYTLTWSSDNSRVATVSQSGMVTAKSVGTANITVSTDNGKTATCKVTVNENTTSVTEYEVTFSIYGYEHGQILYNGAKLAGNVTPGYGSFKVAEGSDVALTILPNSGYTTGWIWVDWDDVSSQMVNNVLTIRNIRDNKDLVVSFEEDEDIVVIVPIFLYCNIGEGGYITSGTTIITGENKIGVGEGDDVTVRIVANNGYHIESVKLDGTDVMSQMSGSELTVKNMTQDRNLTVLFGEDAPEPDEHAVTNENTLALGNVTANTGKTVALPVCLTNMDDITALQMDLYLPEGITPATDDEGDVVIETSSRVTKKHTVDCNRMADGSYRIICYSTSNYTFTGNSGVLFNVMLNVGSDMTDGEYEVSATNIELSDNTGTAYTGQDAIGVITVKSYTLGDTDNNGKHTINDAVCIINHILNQPNAVFVEAAADLDGNGKITINDAVLLISEYILGTTSNARRAAPETATVTEENYMSIDNTQMMAGEERIIEVMMTNSRDDIKGIQCDITLPQGLSFVYDDENEDYVSASSRIPRKLTLSSEMQGNNTLRVAGVCTGNSCIQGNSGTVFTFKVKADNEIMAGMYEILLSNVELSYGEAISVTDRSSVLEIMGVNAGIESISSEGEGRPAVYDLRGLRVDTSKVGNGIYIINGRKVYVK